MICLPTWHPSPRRRAVQGNKSDTLWVAPWRLYKGTDARSNRDERRVTKGREPTTYCHGLYPVSFRTAV